MTWSIAVDFVRGGLFSLAHFCGGSMGLAIIVASLTFRAMMLPFAIRAARRQAAAPSRKNVFDAGVLAQLPVGIALYAAIRGVGERAGGFLWVKTLARPDRMLATIAALLAGGCSWLAASAQTLNGAPAGSTAKGIALAISALLAAGMTLAFLSHMSAGVAVYSITSSVAGVGERRLIARLAARTEPAKR
jgi:membrane protein insertase Oxa1/YidC/SpoIIIJ